MMTKKNDLNRIEERQKFIQVYQDFYNWLRFTLGFRFTTYKDSSLPNYSYSHYREIIPEWYGGVDSFIHEFLKFRINFICDNNSHRLMIVDSGKYSEVMSIEDFKKLLLEQLSELKKNKIAELEYVHQLPF